MEFEEDFKGKLGNDGSFYDNYTINPDERRAREIIINLIFDKERREEAKLYCNYSSVVKTNNNSTPFIIYKSITPEFLYGFQEDIINGIAHLINYSPLSKKEQQLFFETLKILFRTIGRWIRKLEENKEIGEKYYVTRNKHDLEELNVAYIKMIKLICYFGVDNKFFPVEYPFKN